jgi:hypothetical protein
MKTANTLLLFLLLQAMLPLHVLHAQLLSHSEFLSAIPLQTAGDAP